MHKRLISLAAIILVLVCVLALSVAAATQTVYVKSGGTGDGLTASAPVGSVDAAISSLTSNGEIVVIGELPISSTITLVETSYCYTLKGQSGGAVLGYNNTSAGTIKFGTYTRLQTLIIKAADAGLSIIAAYNGTEISSNVSTSGEISFYAGHNVFGDVDPSGTAVHDMAKYVSSDANQYIYINGGSYTNFVGGNARFSAKAPIGTFSGYMILKVGPTVTVGNNNAAQVGINGRNYLTGRISARLESRGSGNIDEYCDIGTLTDVTYDMANNSGTVVFEDCTVSNSINYVGDFNNDGSVTVKDVALSLNYLLNGFDATKSEYYNGQILKSFIEVIRLLKKATA